MEALSVYELVDLASVAECVLGLRCEDASTKRILFFEFTDLLRDHAEGLFTFELFTIPLETPPL